MPVSKEVPKEPLPPTKGSLLNPYGPVVTEIKENTEMDGRRSVSKEVPEGPPPPRKIYPMNPSVQEKHFPVIVNTAYREYTVVIDGEKFEINQDSSPESFEQELIKILARLSGVHETYIGLVKPRNLQER